MKKFGMRVTIKNDKCYIVSLQNITFQGNVRTTPTSKAKHWPLKIIFCISLLVMIFSGPFAERYSYIPEQDISNELLKLQNDMLSGVDLQPCGHDAMKTGTRLDIPDFDGAVKFEQGSIDWGQYYPKYCKPQYSTAIIVPYRNRERHLEIFLPYIHNFLRKQELHYRIFIVSQDDNKPWNKGKLFNAAARVVSRLGYKCMILHDIDLLPLHEANLYACTNFPRHMSANVDKFRYTVMYKTLVGGVLAITTDQYNKINGYSNKFELWGGEDDEFSDRLKSEKLTIQRFSPNVSIYTMLAHRQEAKNEDRHLIRKENRGKYKEDGLNSLRVNKTRILYHPLYTNISVVL